MNPLPPSNSSTTSPPESSSTSPPKKAEAAAALPSAVEFEPPLACVRRILKHTLPATTNVGKDASAAFARASGIFIIYLTTCANDFARENKRQTITANDVLAAIKELGFDQFTPEMMSFLESYRVAEKSKKDAKAAAVKAAKHQQEEEDKAEEDDEMEEAKQPDDEKLGTSDRKRPREESPSSQDKDDTASDKNEPDGETKVSASGEAAPVVPAESSTDEPDAKRLKTVNEETD